MNHRQLLTLIIILAAMIACSEDKNTNTSRIIFDAGAYPFVTEHNGTYYYTMQNGVDSIVIYSTQDMSTMEKAEGKPVWTTEDNNMHHFWSPELHRIDNKWYLYFECDDNNTDNHQIYVLENLSDDPLQGKWTQRGPIITYNEWNFGIHPNTFTAAGRQYLLWSGWLKRRTETETQCIFIAEMENPWTLKSDRVLLSMPEYEWERQWINPDGTRSAYPIFVNENPEAIISPDGKNVIVTYSASGIWTTYNTLGMLYARTDSNLLDPKSWTKLPEPQFVADDTQELFGTSNISVVVSPDKNNTYMIFEAKHYNGNTIVRDIRMKEITWDKNSLPVFGKP